jgi:hypothetical protein
MIVYYKERVMVCKSPLAVPIIALLLKKTKGKCDRNRNASVMGASGRSDRNTSKAPPVPLSDLQKTRHREGVKKSQDSQSGQGDVGKTVERLPLSGLMIGIENHVRLIS